MESVQSWRKGNEEIAKARKILEAELPAELKPQVFPVLSPGWATLVVTLYEEYGCRGAKLDPTPFQHLWVRLANGSSSVGIEDIFIAADEQSSTRYLRQFVGKFYKLDVNSDEDRWLEGTVHLTKKPSRAEFLGVPVKLLPQEFNVLYFLVKRSKEGEDYITEADIRNHLGENPDATEVISRIRIAFRKAALRLNPEVRAEAHELVKELFPIEKRQCGYRVGQTHLFSIVEPKASVRAQAR